MILVEVCHHIDVCPLGVVVVVADGEAVSSGAAGAAAVVRTVEDASAMELRKKKVLFRYPARMYLKNFPLNKPLSVLHFKCFGLDQHWIGRQSISYSKTQFCFCYLFMKQMSSTQKVCK